MKVQEEQVKQHYPEVYDELVRLRAQVAELQSKLEKANSPVWDAEPLSQPSSRKSAGER